MSMIGHIQCRLSGVGFMHVKEAAEKLLNDTGIRKISRMNEEYGFICVQEHGFGARIVCVKD